MPRDERFTTAKQVRAEIKNALGHYNKVRDAWPVAGEVIDLMPKHRGWQPHKLREQLGVLQTVGEIHYEDQEVGRVWVLGPAPDWGEGKRKRTYDDVLAAIEKFHDERGVWPTRSELLMDLGVENATVKVSYLRNIQRVKIVPNTNSDGTFVRPEIDGKSDLIEVVKVEANPLITYTLSPEELANVGKPHEIRVNIPDSIFKGFAQPWWHEKGEQDMGYHYAVAKALIPYAGLHGEPPPHWNAVDQLVREKAHCTKADIQELFTAKGTRDFKDGLAEFSLVAAFLGHEIEAGRLTTNEKITLKYGEYPHALTLAKNWLAGRASFAVPEVAAPTAALVVDEPAAAPRWAASTLGTAAQVQHAVVQLPTQRVEWLTKEGAIDRVAELQARSKDIQKQIDTLFADKERLEAEATWLTDMAHHPGARWPIGLQQTA